jgi:hypothetical protein
MKVLRLVLPMLTACSMLLACSTLVAQVAPPALEDSSLGSISGFAAPERQQTAPVPQALADASRTASTRTEFVLDRPMLELASRFTHDNPELRKVMAALSAVGVHSFHYRDGLEPDALLGASVAQEYRERGFIQLLRKHRNDGGVVSDLWLRMDGAEVREIAVMWMGPRDVNLVTVSGTLSMADLLRLGGHFGVPKMDGLGLPMPKLDR